MKPGHLFVNFLTATGGRPDPEVCFLSGQLRRTLLTKEGFGDSLSDRGSKTQLNDWEADTFLLSYCHPQ